MNTNHYCVILAGGIGMRLWPCSQEAKPKQFIDILGTGETLLQATFRRYSKFIAKENILVLSNEKYADLCRQQLPQLPADNLLLEPMRRNTVPSVTWAAIHLIRRNPQAVMLVTPADQLITDYAALETDMKKGFDYVSRHNRLLTMGITPTRPETAFGYIQMGVQRADNIHQVKSFTEKPEKEFANMFLESHEFLWNTGLFLWSASAFLHAIRNLSPKVTDILQHLQNIIESEESIPQLIEDAFAICPNIPLETGVLEKVDNVDVMLCHFGWNDIGTWSQLFNVMPHSDSNNVVLTPEGQKPGTGMAMFYDTDNTIVSLPQGKVAVIQGLHDCAVIDTGNIIMICKKEDQSSIRKFVNDYEMRILK